MISNINNVTMKLLNTLMIGVGVLILPVLMLTACDNVRSEHNTDKNDTAEINSFALNLPVENIETVNFYFENSASMNGYLDGNSFLETMIRIIGNIDDDKMNSFFVNTNEHKVDNILSRIEKKDIAVGDISKSDHQFIFKYAIENATDNKLRICNEID